MKFGRTKKRQKEFEKELREIRKHDNEIYNEKKGFSKEKTDELNLEIDRERKRLYGDEYD